MADYVTQLAGDYEGRAKAARERWAHLRAEALGEGLDGRLPEQVAYLMLGYELALQHWARCGALSDDDRPDREEDGWRVLVELARQHGSRVSQAQPAEAFRAALVELLAAGDVHLADVSTGEAPTVGAERYGWRKAASDSGKTYEKAQGQHIGWVDTAKSKAYLLSAPALESVAEALRKSGRPIALRPLALWRQCRERGYLLPGDSGADGQRSTRGTWIQGRKINVLVFDLKALGMCES